MSRRRSGKSSMRPVRTFLKAGTWSETLLRVLNHAFDQPLKPEERAAASLAGGILQHGYQCGMIWGAALAAGGQAYRLYGPGTQAQARAIVAAQKLVESFRSLNKHIDCFDITHVDKSSSTLKMITYFLLKGGTIRCFRMAAKYAPAAYDEVSAALSDTTIEAPPPPVSCAAVLAERRGLSEMQIVMAAALAGGIGLCGGACGALGAALWAHGVKNLQDGSAKTGFNDPGGSAIVDRFLTRTDHEFECSRIIGRRFEGIEDHANYLRNGGCSEIIEALATVWQAIFFFHSTGKRVSAIEGVPADVGRDRR